MNLFKKEQNMVGGLPLMFQLNLGIIQFPTL